MCLMTSEAQLSKHCPHFTTDDSQLRCQVTYMNENVCLLTALVLYLAKALNGSSYMWSITG